MDPAQEAIQAALHNDWPKAIELNEAIYKGDQSDIGALLRLAHAYFESGDVKNSKEYAQLALLLDPANSLAKKCLEKCSVGKISQPGTHKTTNLRAFLEVPGKSRLVRLVQLGEPKTLAGLCSGESVQISVNSHKVTVETQSGEHIGRIPDDIAAKVTNTKNASFWAAIKQSGPNDVSIMMHER